MKYKQTISILIICIMASFAFGQEIEESYDLGSPNDITIVADYPKVTVHKASGNQVEVKATSRMNGIPYPGIISLDWDRGGNRLEVTSDFSFKDDMSKEQWEKYVDEMNCEELKENWKSGKNGGWGRYGNWNFNSHVEVYLPARISGIKVKSTYGSVELEEALSSTTVDNTYGSIEARIDGSFKKCDLTSTYSTVTLVMPDNQSSNIRLESHYGEIYTNIDFDIDKKNSVNKQFKNIIKGALRNGGSREVSLRSDYSDVYLKKG